MQYGPYRKYIVSAKAVGGGILLAVAAYASGLAVNWYRYGRVRRPADGDDRDPQLPRYLLLTWIPPGNGLIGVWPVSHGVTLLLQFRKCRLCPIDA